MFILNINKLVPVRMLLDNFPNVLWKLLGLQQPVQHGDDTWYTKQLTHIQDGVLCGRVELLVVKIESPQSCLCELGSTFHLLVFYLKTTSWGHAHDT